MRAKQTCRLFQPGSQWHRSVPFDVFCHVIFDINIDAMDFRGRPQQFVALELRLWLFVIFCWKDHFYGRSWTYMLKFYTGILTFIQIMTHKMEHQDFSTLFDNRKHLLLNLLLNMPLNFLLLIYNELSWVTYIQTVARFIIWDKIVSVIISDEVLYNARCCVRRNNWMYMDLQC